MGLVLGATGATGVIKLRLLSQDEGGGPAKASHQDGEEDVEQHYNDEEVEHEEEARRHGLPPRAAWARARGSADEK